MRTAFIFVCFYASTVCAQNVGIGTTTPNGQLQLSNLLANRKVVLFEGANNDHGFYGFGVNGGVLRYQVNTTGDNHVFYAGVSSVLSNELMRIQGNGLVGIGNSSPAYRLHLGNYSTPSSYMAISTAGGQLYKAGLKLRHFDDNNGWTLESDETVNLFRILRHNNNAAGVTTFSIDQGGSILMGNSLDNSAGNIGIGTPILLNVKLYAKSTENVTALLENTSAGNWSLQSFGNTLLSNSLDNSQGNVYIGHSTLGTAKLYLKSNQDFGALIEDLAPGKIALQSNGNTVLGNSLDASEGNVYIGHNTLGTAKLHVKSNEDYTALIENTGGKTALQTVGITTFCTSADATSGNVGIGGAADGTVKLLVNSNQVYSAYIQNLNFPNTALAVIGHTVLSPSADMQYGNVGMGAGAGVNSKLHVLTNLTYGIFVENPGKTAIAATGDVMITGTISKGGGSFKIDHPLDPANKYLYHSFVESPDMMNVYNGNITTGADGEVTVTLPDYFEALNKDFRYQLTVIGEFAQAIVYRKITNNRFVIKTDKPNIEVSWQVTGIRKDKFAEQNRIPTEVEKTGEERGKYLYPSAYGLPESFSIMKTLFKEAQSGGFKIPDVKK
jgi:hypothetical protein